MRHAVVEFDYDEYEGESIELDELELIMCSDFLIFTYVRNLQTHVTQLTEKEGN